MNINVLANSFNITVASIQPDVGRYGLVTIDGNFAGTFSILVVPELGWDDATVKQNFLNWFGLTEA